MEELQQSNKHIRIMGIIGIIFAVVAILVASIEGIIILTILPIICIVCYMKTKNPLYGIIYTCLFISGHLNVFINGHPFLIIFYVFLICYFIKVNRLSIQAWKLQGQQGNQDNDEIKKY